MGFAPAKFKLAMTLFEAKLAVGLVLHGYAKPIGYKMLRKIYNHLSHFAYMHQGYISR